jgi:hypothetical protein
MSYARSTTNACVCGVSGSRGTAGTRLLAWPHTQRRRRSVRSTACAPLRLHRDILRTPARSRGTSPADSPGMAGRARLHAPVGGAGSSVATASHLCGGAGTAAGGEMRVAASAAAIFGGRAPRGAAGCTAGVATGAGGAGAGCCIACISHGGSGGGEDCGASGCGGAGTGAGGAGAIGCSAGAGTTVLLFAGGDLLAVAAPADLLFDALALALLLAPLPALALRAAASASSSASSSAMAASARTPCSLCTTNSILS